jgi:hypothetical protein
VIESVDITGKIESHDEWNRDSSGNEWLAHQSWEMNLGPPLGQQWSRDILDMLKPFEGQMVRFRIEAVDANA